MTDFDLAGLKRATQRDEVFRIVNDIVARGGMQMHFTPRAEVERLLGARGCHVDAVLDTPELAGKQSPSVAVLFSKPWLF